MVHDIAGGEHARDAGLLRDVEFHLPYKKVYDQIRTIKRDAQVIARKVKTPSGMELRLTGKGYNPKNK